MFTTLWNRMSASPLAAVLLVLASAVIAGQLYAMAWVVRGQVERAQLRASLPPDPATTIAAARRHCVQGRQGAYVDVCAVPVPQGVITVASRN